MVGSRNGSDSNDRSPTAGFSFPSHLSPVRLIGTGSAATVLLARDASLKRLVAVKFLGADLAGDHRVRRRFEREAQAAARLSHENITTVYSVGRNSDDVPYIEMQYVDGTNLRDLMKARGKFAVDEVIEIVSQIASALAHAHEHSIVHRDVAPENVLIDKSSSNAMLTDFGVAAVLETGSEQITKLTREGERLGDPRYMSPEQLLGLPLTGQSDVYSLAVIAWEMLCGRGPFDDETTRDSASAHLRAAPPDLTGLRDDVPGSLADTLRRCLSKQPQHRPHAGDVAKLLGSPDGASAGDTTQRGPLLEFLVELQKRKVYKAAAAYAAIMFVLLQVVDLIMPAWPRLESYYRLLVIVCLAGFPVTVLVAWFFDLRYWRLVRTAAPDETAQRWGVQRRILMAVGFALSIAVALTAAWVILLR